MSTAGAVARPDHRRLMGSWSWFQEAAAFGAGVSVPAGVAVLGLLLTVVGVVRAVRGRSTAGRTSGGGHQA